MCLPAEIFKAYDIRGIVGRTLTAPIVAQVGQALGTLALEHGGELLVGEQRYHAQRWLGGSTDGDRHAPPSRAGLAENP